MVLAASHRVYWKAVKDDADSVPKSLFDFRNHSSLELSRLDASATWEYVEDRVKPENSERASVSVRRRLHGRARRTTLGSDVKIVLTATNKEQSNKWMLEIRLRIAPWELLHRRAKDLLLDSSEKGRRTSSRIA